MPERVQKIISNSGYCSRRKAEELIANGYVLVNGKQIKLGDKADPEKDIVTINGKPLDSEKKRYILLNKPIGYTTTMSDPHEKKIISSLVSVKERVFPIGRLDKDSEGLLILTNDGEFANKIMHPSFEVKKTYYVKADKIVSVEDLKKLESGIMIEGRKTSDASCVKISANEVEITIHEGRKRIVRKMFAALGYNVLRLVRTRIGRLSLGSLAPGKYRELSKEELGPIFQ